MSMSDADHIAFDTWPEWRLALDSPPSMIRRLAGGLTNQNYLLKAAGLRLVMRVNHSDSTGLGIDRQREQEILEKISGKAFAPVVFYCDPARGVLVTQYIEGYQWQPNELADTIKVDSLVNLVRQIHEISEHIPPFDYGAHVRNYWQQLLESNQPFPMTALKLYRSIEARLPDFQEAIKEPVLCHHDLTPANIIENSDGQLLVLDWEYAGAGSPLIEAVGLARYWQHPDLATRIHTRAEDKETLQLAEDIVDFYELAWSLLRQQTK